MTNLEKSPQIILASSSETRIKMLSKYFKNIIIEKHNVDEERTKKKFKNLDPISLVKKLARLKAESILSQYTNKLIISGDQILVCENKILSKPNNLDEALQNLKFLVGKDHFLYSAIHVINKNIFFYEELKYAKLFFKKKKKEILKNYLNQNKSTALNSVGSYKIEENKRHNFIDIKEGDLETILGFPLKGFLKKFKSEVI